MKAIRYDNEMIEEYFSKGYWTNETFAGFWDRNAEKFPEKEALIDQRKRLTWLEAKQWTDRLALGLLELGIKRDEVITSQLPSWIESIAVPIALEKAGILCASAMITWRQAEMEHAIKTTQAVGVIIPWEFDGFNYFEMIQEIRPALPS